MNNIIRSLSLARARARVITVVHSSQNVCITAVIRRRVPYTHVTYNNCTRIVRADTAFPCNDVRGGTRRGTKTVH